MAMAKEEMQAIEKARTNVADFIEYVMRDEDGEPLKLAPMHRTWQEAIDTHGRVVITAHPQSGMTTQALGRVLFELGRDPGWRIVVVTETQAAAQRFAQAVALYFCRSHELRSVFPATIERDKAGGVFDRLEIAPVFGAPKLRGIDLLIFVQAQGSHVPTAELVQRKRAWCRSYFRPRLTGRARVVVLDHMQKPEDVWQTKLGDEAYASVDSPVTYQDGTPRWPAKWSLEGITRTRVALGPVEAARLLDCVILPDASEGRMTIISGGTLTSGAADEASAYIKARIGDRQNYHQVDPASEPGMTEEHGELDSIQAAILVEATLRAQLVVAEMRRMHAEIGHVVFGAETLVDRGLGTTEEVTAAFHALAATGAVCLRVDARCFEGHTVWSGTPEEREEVGCLGECNTCGAQTEDEEGAEGRNESLSAVLIVAKTSALSRAGATFIADGKEVTVADLIKVRPEPDRLTLRRLAPDGEPLVLTGLLNCSPRRCLVVLKAPAGTGMVYFAEYERAQWVPPALGDASSEQLVLTGVKYTHVESEETGLALVRWVPVPKPPLGPPRAFPEDETVEREAGAGASAIGWSDSAALLPRQVMSEEGWRRLTGQHDRPRTITALDVPVDQDETFGRTLGKPPLLHVHPQPPVIHKPAGEK